MKFTWILIIALILSSCGGGMSKILKNPDPAYKLRIAEQYFVKMKYSKAQQV
jgi:outer membrane protein assembly factor BamD